jgi:hypothetical protein
MRRHSWDGSQSSRTRLRRGLEILRRPAACLVCINLMAKSETIQLTDPKADRARLESIVMIAVAAWGVGFLLMLGVARLLPNAGSADRSAVARARGQLPNSGPQRTRAVSSTRGMPGTLDSAVAPNARNARNQRSEKVHVVRPAPLPAHAAASAKSTPAADSKPLVAAPTIASKPTTNSHTQQLTAAAAPDLTSKPAQATAKKRAPKRTFAQGVLAYLRCEGSERPHARFPCPRDPKLEEQVWHALEALPMCDTDPGSGSAELRLLLRRSQIQSVEWKASTSAPGLNLRAASKCAGAKLAEVRTRLHAPESLVSFRFSLE